MNKQLVKSPTLLLDVNKCRNNIRRMAEKARKHQLALRPHFKTHQSGIVGEWIREEGVYACTVSSVMMARYFADEGWSDILIAFPVNIREHEAINQLADEVSLQILVYDRIPLEILGGKINTQVGVKIELDLGSGRSGLLPTQTEDIGNLLAFIGDHPRFEFTGFYSHPGHTYTARSKEQVLKIYADFMPGLDSIEENFSSVPGYSITVGDTPGCTLVEDFGPVKEISPGNFVFYDVMQVNIGSSTYDEIAVVMACPVVGKKPETNEILVHGGAVHFSKEVLTDADGTVHFGKLAQAADSGWEGVLGGCYLKSISQEHGLVRATENLMNDVRIGDLLYIYPAHSCLSADQVKAYLTTKGKFLNGDSAFMS